MEALVEFLVCHALKFWKEEANKVKALKPLSNDLASTLGRLVSITENIDSSQNTLDHGVGDLKEELKQTMKRADTVVKKCSSVHLFSLNKSKLTREIEQVNKDMLKFYQLEIQLQFPPGAACPSSSAASVPCPQAPLKQDSFPMNSPWKKGKLLGCGTFGKVYVASNSENGALCAMKEVELFPDDPKSAECVNQLEQEMKLLSNLQHPNIVQYFGSETVEDRFFIYLEYVHPGSINKYIRDYGGTLTESVVRSFTRHILSGLAYLHSKKTVHRDVKGANLLVDASGVVKLADFGVAKHLTGQRAELSLKGSAYWMAPELMQAVMQKDSNPDLAFAVDIWSLGCTIIEMFTGKPPWRELEWQAAMFKVFTESPPIPESMSPEGKDFLRLCFQRKPAERPTASMLLEHRFLKNSLQPTSPNNNDVSNCSQLFNEMNITEPSSRREKPNFKLDQVPRARNVTSSESEIGSSSNNNSTGLPFLS